MNKEESNYSIKRIFNNILKPFAFLDEKLTWKFYHNKK